MASAASGSRICIVTPAAVGVEGPDRAAHRLDEALGHGEPEPDATGGPVVQSLERVEDPQLGVCRDAGAVVDDLDADSGAVGPGGEIGRPAGGGEPHGVGQRRWQAPVRAGRGRCRPAAGRRAGRAVRVPVSPRSASGATSSSDGRPHQRVDRPGLQPAQVEQVADQPVEPVGALLDRREQGLPVLLGQGDVGLPQAADAGLDRGQRCTQVVADGGQQCGPDPVALGRALRLGGLLAEPVAVERGGSLRGEAVDQPRARRCAWSPPVSRSRRFARTA